MAAATRGSGSGATTLGRGLPRRSGTLPGARAPGVQQYPRRLPSSGSSSSSAVLPQPSAPPARATVPAPPVSSGAAAHSPAQRLSPCPQPPHMGWPALRP